MYDNGRCASFPWRRRTTARSETRLEVQQLAQQHVRELDASPHVVAAATHGEGRRGGPRVRGGPRRVERQRAREEGEGSGLAERRDGPGAPRRVADPLRRRGLRREQGRRRGPGGEEEEPVVDAPAEAERRGGRLPGGAD